MLAPPEQADPVMQAIAAGSRDASNPDARAFAIRRLHQLVRAGLLGGMPQNMADPTATWRGLSSTLGQNPDALTQFLAAAQTPPAQPAAAQTAALAGNGYTSPELVSEHGYQQPVPRPAPQLVSEHGQQLPTPHYVSDARFLPGHPLPGHPAMSIAQMRAALQAAMQRGAGQQFGHMRR